MWPLRRYPSPRRLPCSAWRYHSTADAFSSSNGGIEWGRAYPETKSISLLTVVSLAPKEILRQVATHEALHIVYSLLVPSCLTESKIDFSVSEYPIELQQEEQWVRNMMKNLGFNESYLEFWEVAVEEAGGDWKQLYYKLKKNPPNLE